MNVKHCKACGVALVALDVDDPPTIPRLEVVSGDGARIAWCARCCSEASYAGPLWAAIQAAIYLTTRGAKEIK